MLECTEKWGEKTRACGTGVRTSIHKVAQSEDDAKIELAAGCWSESVGAREVHCDAVEDEGKPWARTLSPGLT